MTLTGFFLHLHFFLYAIFNKIFIRGSTVTKIHLASYYYLGHLYQNALTMQT